VLAPRFVAADPVIHPVVFATDFISPYTPVVLLLFGPMAHAASQAGARPAQYRRTCGQQPPPWLGRSSAKQDFIFFLFVASVIFLWEPSAAILHQFHSCLVFALPG
jgi:hypothetical protein